MAGVGGCPPDGARVLLDGVPIEGDSPLVIQDLAPGAYEVRVQRSGYAEWKRTLVLDSGGMTEEEVRLVPAQVRPARLRLVTVPADALVRIGSRTFSPGERAVHLDVPASRRLLVVATRDGYHRKEMALELEPGESHTETLELVPTPGSLFIDSEPPGDVFLNDKKVGRTPYRNTTLSVRGKWRVKVTRSRYRPHEQTVRFGDRRVVEVDVKLKKR